MTGDDPLTESQWSLVTENIRLPWWIARRMTSARPWRQDEAYDSAFKGLLKAARRYRPEAGSFSTYASTLIKREIICRFRNLSRRKRWAIPFCSIDDIDPTEMPTEHTGSSDGELDFDILIEPLPDRERDVLRLKFRSGCDRKSISKELGICCETVRKIESKAIRRLRWNHLGHP